jgi:hypothetical protein
MYLVLFSRKENLSRSLETFNGFQVFCVSSFFPFLLSERAHSKNALVNPTDPPKFGNDRQLPSARAEVHSFERAQVHTFD